MYPVRLIKLSEHFVMSDSPHNICFYNTNEWAPTTDGQIINYTVPPDVKVIPITKLMECSVNNRSLYEQSFGQYGAVKKETYIALDTSDCPYIEQAISNVIEIRISQLKQKHSTEMELAKQSISGLKDELKTIKEAPWYKRLKWIFKGV